MKVCRQDLREDGQLLGLGTWAAGKGGELGLNGNRASTRGRGEAAGGWGWGGGWDYVEHLGSFRVDVFVEGGQFLHLKSGTEYQWIMSQRPRKCIMIKEKREMIKECLFLYIIEISVLVAWWTDLESCGPGLNLGFSRSNIASASPSVKWRWFLYSVVSRRIN